MNLRILKFQICIMIYSRNIFQEFQKESSRDNISWSGNESDMLIFHKNIMIHRKNIFQEFQKESSRGNISWIGNES